MRARRDGHEVLLQVPMEPFDFPDSDPGPHTLRASGAAKDNIERLHWLMTRFSGYVGLMNYMGGKVLSTPQALQPVFDEMAKRGLLFLDDGTTTRSVTGDVGSRLSLPVLRADRAMDATGNSVRSRRCFKRRKRSHSGRACDCHRAGARGEYRGADQLGSGAWPTQRRIGPAQCRCWSACALRPPREKGKGSHGDCLFPH